MPNWRLTVLFVGECRTRRRQAREQTGKRAEHKEGLSSDDEETSTDIASFNTERGTRCTRDIKTWENLFLNMDERLEAFHSPHLTKVFYFA